MRRWLVICVGFPILMCVPPLTFASVFEPTHVGATACADCHDVQHQAWTTSHHRWALTPPEGGFVLGDFNGARFRRTGIETQFHHDQGGYRIETLGADGKPASFPVRFVVGVTPLQQYLLEPEPGRLQALDIAWDTLGKRWYHLYPATEDAPGNGLHWTGPYKNWNGRCAECHVTGHRKAYDPNRRRYQSTQEEITVTCEACHGPGQAHLAWADAPDRFAPQDWDGVGRFGLTVTFRADAPESEIQQCAGCHSRREQISADSPAPGTPFHDGYRLSLLRPSLYHPDGQILNEVYVYGSFLQSTMYAEGVRCSDCHDPHAGTLRAEGDGVCTQCHSLFGNTRFPSLRRADFESTEHHLHAPGSTGAACASCHMLVRVYMGVDPRHDHSFRVPRPDLSAEIGTPNTCGDCHDDRPVTWAAAALAQHVGPIARKDNRAAALGRSARTFAAAAATSGPLAAATISALLTVAEDRKSAGIVRATALDFLRRSVPAAVAARAAPYLADPDPLVRAAAVSVQANAPPTLRLARLRSLMTDPRANVRLEVARALLGVAVPRADAGLQRQLGGVFREYQTFLYDKADFPETQMAIGGTALALRNTRAAEAAFREAVGLDPQLVQAWRMMARLRAAHGDTLGARRVLEEGLAVNPGASVLVELRASLRP